MINYRNIATLVVVCSIISAASAMQQEFIDALHNGDMPTVDKFLADKEFDVNAPNDTGWTPLFRMCSARNVAMAQRLLKCPRTLTCVHTGPVTAYHAVVWWAFHSDAEKSAQECALIRAIYRTEKGRHHSPVIHEQLPDRSFENKKTLSPLNLAIKNGCAHETIRCLLACGALRDKYTLQYCNNFDQEHGYNRIEPVLELLGTQECYKELFRAIDGDYKYVEETAANYPVIIKQWHDYKNRNCAHVAVERGNKRSVGILLKYGADFTTHRNDDGQSALDIARQHESLKDIADLIQQHNPSKEIQKS